VGGNALLAETVEDTTGPLDTFASGMGGTFVRRPLDEVVAELEAQQAAAEEAEKAARKAIREQKKQEHKETREQRVAALKAKFHK
jgi:20S proteasome alpha/beta subunit